MGRCTVYRPGERVGGGLEQMPLTARVSREVPLVGRCVIIIGVALYTRERVS